ncbi:MAG: pantetheine-phosphate adenylyltransferase [Acidobacteriota bacterium]
MTAALRTAVFAGSFDPLTNGHVDIITRSARLFDRVVIAVLINASKRPLFTIDERVGMIRAVVADHPNVEVATFEGLLAEFVQRRGATVVIRGLRTASEFSDEWQMAMANRHLYGDFETLFLMPSATLTYISSHLVKEIAALGGSLSGLVPPVVAAALRERYPSPGVVKA